jgi:hypothetical protein
MRVRLQGVKNALSHQDVFADITSSDEGDRIRYFIEVDALVIAQPLIPHKSNRYDNLTQVVAKAEETLLATGYAVRREVAQ